MRSFVFFFFKWNGACRLVLLLHVFVPWSIGVDYGESSRALIFLAISQNQKMAQDSQKKVLELFAHANSSIGASTASITLKVIGCIFAVAVHTWQSSPSPFKIFHTWRPKHGQGVMEFSLTEPS